MRGRAGPHASTRARTRHRHSRKRVEKTSTAARRARCVCGRVAMAAASSTDYVPERDEPREDGEEEGEGGQTAATENEGGQSSTATGKRKKASGAGTSGGDDGGASGAGKDANRRFQRELRSMMYGFGDDRQPLAQSVLLMEDLVVDYVHSVLHQSQLACEQRQRTLRSGGGGQIKERDLLFALRKDRAKKERVHEILEVWKEVRKATNKKDHRSFDKDD